MFECILVWRRKDDRKYYAMGALDQGAFTEMIRMIEHFAGVYSYVLFNFTVRPLRWQIDATESIAVYSSRCAQFMEDYSSGMTGPGLEKP